MHEVAEQDFKQNDDNLPPGETRNDNDASFRSAHTHAIETVAKVTGKTQLQGSLMKPDPEMAQGARSGSVRVLNFKDKDGNITSSTIRATPRGNIREKEHDPIYSGGLIDAVRGYSGDR